MSEEPNLWSKWLKCIHFKEGVKECVTNTSTFLMSLSVLPLIPPFFIEVGNAKYIDIHSSYGKIKKGIPLQY